MSNSSKTKFSAYAARARGAMFFAVFGAAWLALWNQRALHGNILIYVCIAVLGAGILLLAVNRYRLFKDYAEDGNSPEGRKSARLFHLINAAQWIIILVLANILANMGLAAWVIPMTILVVGLHFLPLAKIFASPGHIGLGLALSLFAISYPFVFSGGPNDPYGCFGAGLALWTYALWKLCAGWSLSLPLTERSEYK